MSNERYNYEKLNEEYEKVMTLCQKPGRYSGGEYNSYNKIYENLSFCLCFPDVYEVAISNLGVKILYHLINEKTKFACDRCYTPWLDFCSELEKRDLPLLSIEQRKPLCDFDVVGFSIGYEMSYTNMLHMLKLGNIPLRASERGEEHPIIYIGGICTVNPEPMCDFADFIYVGEGEVSTERILEIIEEGKLAGKTKVEILHALDSELACVYVPSFSSVKLENGKFAGLENQKIIKKDYVKNLDESYYPPNMIVPNIEAVHDRAVLELFRGCARGCRFCQAGFCYRPMRAKSVETLNKLALDTINKTGFDEMSLNSLSTSDYPNLDELIVSLQSLCGERGVRLSMPSLRLDNFKSEYAGGSRKTSLTFAPEAGTQRLRDVINKNITEQHIEDGLTKAFECGYTSVKLYFMIGHPTETMEDVEGIFELAQKVKRIYMKVKHRKDVRIVVSVANFVPKPFTPFQWEGQDSEESFKEKHARLRELFFKTGFKLSYHDSFVSKLESFFALGGRETAKVIEKAYLKGCIYDGWDDVFKEETWKEVLEECGINLDKATKGFDINSPLPWQHIHVGVDNEYLKRENALAKSGATTKDCLESCNGCGKEIAGDCKKCWY
ncbi:MAG: TIGR03960 family B12-binding radical SAM protein [Bacillota bacterium]